MISPSFLKEVSLENMIHQICQSVPKESEMLNFIKICIRLSYGYLRYKESRGYRIRESSKLSESKLEDVAIDAIAELFERNTYGEYVQLRRYFYPYIRENHTEEEWIVLLRRLITSRTQQALFRIFKERDPESAKIIRGIKLAVSKDPQFKIVEDFWGNVIVEVNSHSDSAIPKEMTDSVELEVMMKYLFTLFRPADTIPILLQKTFTALNARFDGPPAVEIQEAVRIFRTYRKGVQVSSRVKEIDDVDSVERHLIQDDLKKRIEKIREYLFIKLDRDYLSKGKLDERKTQGFKNALSRMTEDMMTEGSIRPNLAYIQEFLPEVTSGHYQREIRTKFEYFVKLLKTRVQEIVR